MYCLEKYIYQNREREQEIENVKLHIVFITKLIFLGCSAIFQFALKLNKLTICSRNQIFFFFEAFIHMVLHQMNFPCKRDTFIPFVHVFS